MPRNTHNEIDLLADKNDEPPTDDIFALDEQTYGAIERADASMITAVPVDIDKIVPDPRQPRRTMPSVVREIAPPLQHQIVQWALMARSETIGYRVVGFPPNLYKAIIDGGEYDLPKDPGDIEASMLELVGLAADIYQLGRVINPITVARNGDDTYMIETGERRWLAHHLLTELGYEGFDTIPAQIKDAVDVWAQASENNQRSDLNAISRARQYAILLMDLLEKEGHIFESVGFFKYEQTFYAQVADERIPYGKADQILNAMSLKGRQSLNDYSRLLKLPNEAWVAGDDGNLPVADLLKIVRSTDNSPIRDDESGDISQGDAPQSQITPETAPSEAAGWGDADEYIPNEDDAASDGFAPDQHSDDFRGPPPMQKPWPKVGDEVVTLKGHLGTVLDIISGMYQVKTEFRTGLYGKDELRRPMPGDYEREHVVDEPESEGDSKTVTDPATLYSVEPSDDPIVERARQIALGAVGDSKEYLDDRIRGRGGQGGPDGSIQFGGGSVFLDYDTENQRSVKYARDQIAVMLKLDDGERLFRFNAYTLLGWKLAHATPAEPDLLTDDDVDDYPFGADVADRDPMDLSNIVFPLRITPDAISGEDSWMLSDGNAQELAITFVEHMANTISSVLTAVYLSNQVQAMMRVADFIDKREPEGYLPGDALDDLDMLREFIHEATLQAQAELDEVDQEA